MITLTFDETVERMRAIFSSDPLGINPQRGGSQGDSGWGGCQYQRDDKTIDRPNTRENCAVGRFLVEIGLASEVPDGDDNTPASQLLHTLVSEGVLSMPESAVGFLTSVQSAADGTEVYLSISDGFMPENDDDDVEGSEFLDNHPRPWGLVAQYLDAIAYKHRGEVK